MSPEAKRMSLEDRILAEMDRQEALAAGVAPATVQPVDRALAGFLRYRKRRRALDLAAKQKEGA